MKKLFLLGIMSVLLTSAIEQQSSTQKQSNQSTHLGPYENYEKTDNTGAPCKGLKIGDSYKGGIFCGFASSGGKCHGFVCAPTDQENAKWDDAKSICKALRLGGYSDWRLPTKYELHCMCSWLNGVVPSPYESGGTDMRGFDHGTTYYWSSRESSDREKAWCEYFGLCRADYADKNETHKVRAVRSF